MNSSILNLKAGLRGTAASSFKGINVNPCREASSSLQWLGKDKMPISIKSKSRLLDSSVAGRNLHARSTTNELQLCSGVEVQPATGP